MLQTLACIQTHAHSIASERTQSSTIKTITSQSERSDSEHLSFTSSLSTLANPECSIEAKIQILLISRASTILTSSSSSLSENNEDRELRRSGCQMKIRDFWEGEFAAFLAMMAVTKAFAHYKNILNKKDRRKWE